MTGRTLLHPGDPFPAQTVALPGGRALRLPDVMAGRCGVVPVYNRTWCPYCNVQLAAFQRWLEVLASLNVPIVALPVGDEATTRDPVARHGLRPPRSGPTTGQCLQASDDRTDDPAYQPEGGWRPAAMPGVPPPEPSSADRRCPMAPLQHDQDVTSWLQLLSAVEDAEAGRETARLTEICLSVYGALAAAQFQITQLRARVHALTAGGPCPHGSPVTAATPQVPWARWDQRAGSGDKTTGLPAGEQRVLDTIQNQPRITDQQLTGALLSRYI